MGVFQAFLKALPSVAGSPLALIAYVLTLLAWVVVSIRVTRNKNLLDRLQKLPAADRLAAFKAELGHIDPPSGLTPEQWLATRNRNYILIGFAILCATGVAVAALAITHTQEKPKGAITLAAPVLTAHAAAPAAGDSGSHPTFEPATLSGKIGQMPYDPRTAFPDQADRTALSYTSADKGSTLVITPALGYLDAQKAGGISDGFNWEWEPFRWDFPTLSFKISNNSKNVILISEIAINVRSVERINEAVLAARAPGYRGAFDLFNFGWGTVKNPKLSLGFSGVGECNDANFATKINFPLAVFNDHAEINIADVVPQILKDASRTCTNKIESICMGGECVSGSFHLTCSDAGNAQNCGHVVGNADRDVESLRRDAVQFGSRVQPPVFQRQCVAAPICTFGRMSYVGSDTKPHDWKFSLPVYLGEPGVGVPAPPSYAYSVFLPSTRSGYVASVPVQQSIKPGEVDNFTLKIGTDQSVQFLLDVAAQSADVGDVARRDVNLSIFVPRGSDSYVAQRPSLTRLHLTRVSQATAR